MRTFATVLSFEVPVQFDMQIRDLNKFNLHSKGRAFALRQHFQPTLVFYLEPFVLHTVQSSHLSCKIPSLSSLYALAYLLTKFKRLSALYYEDFELKFLAFCF